MRNFEKSAWEKTKRLTSEAVIATFLFYVVVDLSQRFAAQQQIMVPADAWFRVNEVFVPDHESGSNPTIMYDREILESFRGFFIIEVQQQLSNGLWFSTCSGSGVSDYETGGTIPDNRVTWEWFILQPCAVPPGTYRLRMTWDLKRPRWAAKQTVVLSNVFAVF